MKIERIKRHGSYLFWAFGEQAANIGLPRLLLLPLAAYILGKEQIGVFITALSVTSILGQQPANGLATGLLRHLYEYAPAGQAKYCSTAQAMCSWAMIFIVGLGLTIALVLAGLSIVPWQIVNCLIPLIISLYSENQFMLYLTELRINRKFRQRTLWYTARMSVLFVFSIAGTLLFGVFGLAWGYMLGNFISYGILWFSQRMRWNQGYSAEMAKSLKKVWLHMTVAGIISFAGPYLNRIILSFYHSYSDVADLFAASSILFSFMVIISCASYVLLSVLARYKSPVELPRSARVQFLGLLITGVFVLPLIFKVLGPMVFHLIFPKFGDSSLQLLDILIWAMPFVTLSQLTRPFVIKFAPIQVTPLINAISLTATVLPALLLIPLYRMVGAAWAVVAGEVTTGLLWAFFCTTVFYKQASDAHAVPVEQTSCCDSELGGT